MKAKKIIALSLITVVFSLLLSGCNTKPAENKTVQKPIKIFRAGFNMANAQNVVDEISKISKTKVEFMSGGTDGKVKAALMITSGEDVDWVNVDGSQPYKQWGTDGLLVDLRPYLEKYKDELKVINLIANADEFKPLLGTNGEIYGIPAINTIQNAGIRMNAAWLKESGMKKPETLDEIYETLKKFKQMKSNEEGVTPLIAGGMTDFNWIFYAYGGATYKSSNGVPKYYLENGKFKPYDISTMNKEALKYARKLQQEGLVNADWPTLGQTTQVTDRFVGGKAGMWFNSQGVDERLYESQKTVTEWIDAPKGPTGIQSYGGNAPFYTITTVPSASKNDERIYAILKLIEWMHTSEARKLCSFGIGGVHYEINSNGEIDTSKYLENMDRDFARVNGGNSPLEWGFVSGFKGYLDVDKYNNFEDALKNIVIFKVKPKQPVDENYSAWVAHVQKFAEPYPYDAYSIEDLKFQSQKVVEFTNQFYMKAMSQKNFDIDAEWDKFVSDYLTIYNGEKCIEIFSQNVKK